VLFRSLYKNQQLYLRDGQGALRKLGKVCRTDWIGQWSNHQISFGEDPIAGDRTEEADVSGWATDYVEIDLEAGTLDSLKLCVAHKEGGGYLAAQMAVKTKSGNVIFLDSKNIPAGSSDFFDINPRMPRHGLELKTPQKLYLLLTNLDPGQTSRYEISLN
jgi:hypothetical protein